MRKKVNVAIIGTKFMGKAHSNGWLQADKFFDLPYEPVLKMVCAQDMAAATAFAQNWGHEKVESDWMKAIEDPEIDIISICTPTYLHKDIVIAGAKAGKHIICEKPTAMDYSSARQMAEAADRAGVLHYLNHNYRRIPAVAFAKQMIEEGKLGTIYHWRGSYLQDWAISLDTPLSWHFEAEKARSGAHYDLNSHAIDLARFLVGEIKTVNGMMKTFIKERPLLNDSSQKGLVGVDDAAFLNVEFENGALGAFDASRLAGGRKNHNYFEVYGSKGSLLFDLERMNELQYFNREEPVELQGFTTIPTTQANHPYMSAWWPVAHIIGYEHTFSNAIRDFIIALATDQKIEPNLHDGAKIMQVLDAAILSNKEGRRVDVSEI